VATWTPDQLSLRYKNVVRESRDTRYVDDKVTVADTDETNVVGSVIDTPFTRVPRRLFDCMDEVILSKGKLYSSENDFVETVNLLLSQVDRVVRENNAFLMFWDEYRRERKLIRKPKDETRIHSSISALLNDRILLNNIDMARERPTGVGLLDFSFSGTLETGEIVRVCSEFKHAHSDDLLNGLLVQLPEYMETMRTDNGTYCVLWFKGNDFDEPRGYDSTDHLKTELTMKALKAGLGNIRVEVLEFTKPIQPSRK
jgi:hypothetical protein